jgi:hypothetical protein
MTIGAQGTSAGVAERAELAEAAGEQFDRIVGLDDGDADVVRPTRSVEISRTHECTTLAGETIGDAPAIRLAHRVLKALWEEENGRRLGEEGSSGGGGGDEYFSSYG